MFEKNQILYMRFQCIDMYGCPKLLDMWSLCVFVCVWVCVCVSVCVCVCVCVLCVQ